MKRRTVHFGHEHDAIGRGSPILWTLDPARVTCLGRCRQAALDAAAELRALALRAMAGVVVFLDFDGVLNNTEFMLSRVAAREAAEARGEPFDRQSFDPACVARLNRLLTVTGALVVVSSTWRLNSTPRKLTELLRRHGFAGEIIGTTPELSADWVRGAEIQHWLDALPAPPRAWIAIDDDDPGTQTNGRLVRTDFRAGGLTDQKVDEAIAKLSELASQREGAAT